MKISPSTNFELTNTTIIFGDGACSGNPGKGGWGAVIASPDGEIIELGGVQDMTTNNRMELTAVQAALENILYSKNPTEKIWLYSDSVYVLRGITQWVWGWQKRGWKSSDGGEVANQDLWKMLIPLVSQVQKKSKIEWKYSRGHVGIAGNERCDEIAVGFSKGKWVDLYRGPLLKYAVAIYDLPENAELPEPRTKTEKKTAHSYLSYVNGKLLRHSTWPECEAVVKGRSGAKFKKTTDADDEAEIISAWGLDPLKD